MHTRRLLPASTAVAMFVLAACSGDSGPYAPREPALPIVVTDSVTLTAAEGRPVRLKIFYPNAEGPFPLVVLSHGTFSNRNRYDRIAAHWAGQGYVVMLPQHVDGDYGVQPSSYDAMQDVIRTRVADMSLVLDELDAMVDGVPDLAGRVDDGVFIAAGHSIGTQVAMLVTGARFRTAFNGETMESPEDRYRALILVSDPGKMRLMPPDAWAASAVPTFMATGTDDFGLMGGRGEPTEAQTDVLTTGAFDDVERYELLLDGGDHYFGGLIQKEVDAEPDHDGLALFNTASTAFLDAVVKGNSAARRYLDELDLHAETAGRATLTKRDTE